MAEFSPIFWTVSPIQRSLGGDRKSLDHTLVSHLCLVQIADLREVVKPIVTSVDLPFQVVDHYENPRNVGSLDKTSKNVGTGLVGAPACGDVMKLQVCVNQSSPGKGSRVEGGSRLGLSQL